VDLPAGGGDSKKNCRRKRGKSLAFRKKQKQRDVLESKKFLAETHRNRNSEGIRGRGTRRHIDGATRHWENYLNLRPRKVNSFLIFVKGSRK